MSVESRTRGTSSAIRLASLALCLIALVHLESCGLPPAMLYSPAYTWNWPPPEPTSVCVQSKVTQSTQNPAANHYALARSFAELLDAKGYVDRKWYVIPNAQGLVGFVVVTRLEQIDDLGSPKELPERWSAAFPSADGLGLWTYIKQLIIPVKGHYRAFVIAATSLPVTEGDHLHDTMQAQDWLRAGRADIPPELKDFPYDATNESVAVYVYEFRSISADDPALFVREAESNLTCKMHLERSGLTAML